MSSINDQHETNVTHTESGEEADPSLAEDLQQHTGDILHTPQGNMEQEQDETNTVTEATSETAEAVDAIVVSKAKLPPDIREEAEKLFTTLLAARDASREDGGKKWSKSSEDQKNIVALAGMMFEYNNQVPELTMRSNNTISQVVARKALKSVPSLNDIEQRVLTLLNEKITVTADRQKKSLITTDQKKMIIAKCRLLRKRDLDTKSRKEFLESIRVGATMEAASWVEFNYENEDKENGTLLKTEQLIPKLYKNVKKQLEEESRPTPSSTSEPGDVSDTLVGAFGNTDEQLGVETVEQPVVESPLASPTRGHEMAGDVFARIEEMNRQNAAIIDIMQNDPEGHHAETCRMLTELTQASIMRLMNAPAGDGNTFVRREAAVVEGNRISLGDDVLGKIQAGAIEMEITTSRDHMGNESSRAVLRKGASN